MTGEADLEGLSEFRNSVNSGESGVSPPPAAES